MRKEIICKGIEKIKKFVGENKTELLQLSIMAVVVILPMVDISICGAAETSKNAALPWNTGLSAMRDEMTGTIPKAGAVIACSTAGVMYAMGQEQGITKRAIAATFGLGIALGAPSLVSVISGTSVSGLLF